MYAGSAGDWTKSWKKHREGELGSGHPRAPRWLESRSVVSFPGYLGFATGEK